MSKFNTTATRAASGTGPIISEQRPSGTTHEGGVGYARDVKSELFLLAVANMVGEATFYEAANGRDSRYTELVRAVAVEDPDWTSRFLRWLRAGANMRSASLVGGLEAARAMLAAGLPGGRQVVASVLQRADEPGEALAYWTSRYGRKIPMPVKNGVADAAVRLYSERSLLKYDTVSKGWRFGDVIDMTHPKPAAPWQGDLFKVALDWRPCRDDVTVPGTLSTLIANLQLRLDAVADPAVLLDPERLAEAGWTWENALSLAGGRVDKARLWEALIPSMGYMALLRNLRNFDEAGVSDQVADQVAVRLADPEQVAKSRQFPFRFYAAHSAVQSLRWGNALEKALRASLANVPALPGRTLVLVDQSPSMFPGYGFSTAQQNRDISNADLAKLFGAAVALRAADATLVGYGNTSARVPFAKGEAVLRLMGKFQMIDGTDTFGAIAQHFDRHDRVVIVTDEQNQPGRYRTIDDVLPRTVPAYVWNIGGYQVGSTASGRNRWTFGGLTDAGFQMIPLLEAGRDGEWPF
ncbi:TROVE domain-containing protein [Dactylosporangium salmoneum]